MLFEPLRRTGMQLSLVRAPAKLCLVPGWQSIGVTVRCGQYFPTGHSGPHTWLSLVGSVATKPATQSRGQAISDEKLAVNEPVCGIHVPNPHVHAMGELATMVGAELLWSRNVQLAAVPLVGIA